MMHKQVIYWPNLVTGRRRRRNEDAETAVPEFLASVKIVKSG